jgi:tetratricopeptide (TPR) repeat protein
MADEKKTNLSSKETDWVRDAAFRLQQLGESSYAGCLFAIIGERGRAKEIADKLEKTGKEYDLEKAGNLYAKIGKKDKVNEVADKLEKIGGLMILEKVGDLYVQIGEKDKAREIAEKMENIGKTEGKKGYFLEAGDLYEKIGDKDKAEQAYKKAGGRRESSKLPADTFRRLKK